MTFGATFLKLVSQHRKDFDPLVSAESLDPGCLGQQCQQKAVLEEEEGILVKSFLDQLTHTTCSSHPTTTVDSVLSAPGSKSSFFEDSHSKDEDVEEGSDFLSVTTVSVGGDFCGDIWDDYNDDGSDKDSSGKKKNKKDGKVVEHPSIDPFAQLVIPGTKILHEPKKDSSHELAEKTMTKKKKTKTKKQKKVKKLVSSSSSHSSRNTTKTKKREHYRNGGKESRKSRSSSSSEATPELIMMKKQTRPKLQRSLSANHHITILHHSAAAAAVIPSSSCGQRTKSLTMRRRSHSMAV